MNNDVFEEIYSQYLNDIYMYLYLLTRDHHVAQDLVQETFVRSFVKLDFPHGNIKAWLLSVAHNIFIDYYRKKKKVVVTENTVLETLADSFSVDRDYEAKEQLRDILRVLEELPLNQRRAVMLTDFNGLSYIEGAKLLGVSLAAYRNLLLRARTKIRSEASRENEP